MDRSPEQPLGSFSFRVQIGTGRAALRLGFTMVEFPPLRIPGAPSAQLLDAAPALLVLHRASTRSLDLYTWWNTTRHARRVVGRTVLVELLDATGEGALRSWRFTGCKPVMLHYSPLDAQRSALLVESLSLSFSDVEIG